MSNPTINELQDENNFELIAKLTHAEIKEFVLEQLAKGGLLVRSFMIYQFAMIFFGMFFLTRSVILSFQGNSKSILYSLGALVFCFSLMIIIHEGLHGIAIKLTGAKKVSYGGYLRKFIFYAEADQHVVNRKQFALIALTPFVVVKVITLVLSIVLINHPALYFIIVVMCAHSLFCAGDIGLLSIFYRNKEEEIYTYDVKAKKSAYFFKKLK